MRCLHSLTERRDDTLFELRTQLVHNILKCHFTFLKDPNDQLFNFFLALQWALGENPDDAIEYIRQTLANNSRQAVKLSECRDTVQRAAYARDASRFNVENWWIRCLVAAEMLVLLRIGREEDLEIRSSLRSCQLLELAFERALNFAVAYLDRDLLDHHSGRLVLDL